jgi:tRNA pseudouridine38-40 synthase
VPTSIIKKSYGPIYISIPKAFGLGLLLKRPIFKSYSKQAESSFDKKLLNFIKFEKKINKFKQK